MGTSSGLYVYDRTTQKIDTVDTKRFIGITSLAFDTYDRLWVSTHEGLYAYVSQEERVIVFGESDGVFTREFLPLPALKTSSGDIYIAGVDGVVRIRPDQEFQRKKIFRQSDQSGFGWFANSSGWHIWRTSHFHPMGLCFSGTECHRKREGFDAEKIVPFCH